MPSTGLFGPYSLSNTNVDICTGASPGVYALGYSKNGLFYVLYVGRSDNNLNSRLKQWVGAYAEFQYGHYDTKKQAFENECHLYHAFSPPDNEIHPAVPDGTSYKCPVCGA